MAPSRKDGGRVGEGERPLDGCGEVSLAGGSKKCVAGVDAAALAAAAGLESFEPILESLFLGRVPETSKLGPEKSFLCCSLPSPLDFSGKGRFFPERASRAMDRMRWGDASTGAV